MRTKPALQSRTLWLAALMILTALVDALAAGAGWRQLLLAVLGAGVGVLRYLTTDPIARPGPRTPSLPVLLLLPAAAACISLRCGAAWPDACKVEDVAGRRELVCRGQKAVVFAEGARPGGTIGVELDGVRLPLRIIGERVTLPVNED